MRKAKIVVVGGGLVGLSFALSMKNANCEIQILEHHLPDLLAPKKIDSRPISLSYGSYRILKSLGIWDELENVACPILSVHISEKGRFGFTEFKAEEQKVPALGFVVPISHLQSALLKQATSQKNIIFTAIKSIEKISTHENGAHILTDSKTIDADLLVAADGTDSVCRDLLKIATDEKNFDDVALIYQLLLSDEHNNTAYERFTNEGVLAVLPLHDKKRAQLVWTRKNGSSDNNNDRDTMRRVFEGRLTIHDVKKISQFPLRTIIAKKQVAQSAILIGNAAHTIYPVAAQGFNLGLHDTKILSSILIDSLMNNKNINDSVILKKYEARASKHQNKIYQLTGQLIGCFELPLIGCFRGLGLLATELLKPIKNRLAKRAMGI